MGRWIRDVDHVSTEAWVGLGRRRRVSEAWGLGRLRPMTLRLSEAWVEGLGLGLAWASDFGLMTK